MMIVINMFKPILHTLYQHLSTLNHSTFLQLIIKSEFFSFVVGSSIRIIIQLYSIKVTFTVSIIHIYSSKNEVYLYFMI